MKSEKGKMGISFKELNTRRSLEQECREERVHGEMERGKKSAVVVLYFNVRAG